jgi:hypothetical protein
MEDIAMFHLLKVGVLGASLLFGMNSDVALSQDRPEIIVKEVAVWKVSEAQGWFDKLIEFHQSREAREIAKTIASFYDVPPPVTEQIVKFGQAIVAGEIVNNGEEMVGVFRAPDGYTFCKAELLEKKIVQTRDHIATFLVAERRALNPNDDGLWYKLLTPKILNEQTSVSGRMRLTYVIADPPRVVKWTQEGKCTQHNVCPWVFDKDGDRYNLANCNPNDTRPDRWLAGQWK